MKPRTATEQDIPALVEMGAKFHAMSPHKWMGEYDGEAVARMLAFLIDNPAGLVMTNGSGVIGGMLAPVYFNPAKLMLDESFWFAERFGRDLLKAFCAKGKEMGAHYVVLSTLENERADLASRLVQRMGFEPLERRSIKRLN